MQFRRKKEEGRRKKEEGRRKKEEGRRKKTILTYYQLITHYQLPITDTWKIPPKIHRRNYKPICT
jgi:hypothetical protein